MRTSGRCEPRGRWWHLAPLLLVLAAAGNARDELRVAGSDVLGIDFSQALHAFARRNDLALKLTFDGSRTGLEKLQTGRADLAILVLSPKERAALASLRTLPLGYHCAVVVVAAECPLEKITLAQLADVFGAAELAGSGGALRWSRLGASGEGSDALVTPLLPQRSAGLAVEIFRRVGLRERAFRPGIERFESATELRAHFAREPRALAVAAAPPTAAEHLKVLPVAASAEQPGVMATPESLHGGDYPLGLELRLVFRPDRQAAIASLAGFLLSDEAAGLLECADVVPAPAAVRADARRGLSP